MIDPDSTRKDIGRLFEIAKDCRLDLIMKDNHTIGGRAENIVKWCNIAKREAERFI